MHKDDWQYIVTVKCKNCPTQYTTRWGINSDPYKELTNANWEQGKLDAQISDWDATTCTQRLVHHLENQLIPETATQRTWGKAMPHMNHIEPPTRCGRATTAWDIQYAVSEILFHPRH